ncbi:GntP family permease [Echinicola sediminis]
MLVNLSILIGFLILLIFSISKWKLHPFIALVLIAMGLGMTMGLGGVETTKVLMVGFSDTLKWIALVVIFGAFIGEVLQETGGALRISDGVVNRVGKKKLPWAMGFTGYLVSIPVFVDVAYILLQPVIESLSVKSKKPVLYIGLSLTAGLTVSHTLIPPTPGPMAVASLLGISVGSMLLINLIVAVFAMVGGILWVMFFCRKAWIDYDKKLENTLKADDGLVETTPKSSSQVWKDIFPILLPILLIGTGSFVYLEGNGLISQVIEFVSVPMVAVLIGAFSAGLTLKRKGRRSKLNQLVEQAIVKSALVIMITGAGGALGHVIKETGIQQEIVTVFADFPFLGILLPFIVASLLTISTGSITVSLVSSASMLGPMVDHLPISPEITAALIGAGSFCVFHANSSFFWLLNRLHEVPPKVLYKTYTLQSLAMGLTGLVVVLILHWLGF